MVGSLLLRGMLVGAVAGVLAFGFARIYGEPQVDRAIAFEAQVGKAADHGNQHAGLEPHAGHTAEPSHTHETELVSRETQAGLGLLTGVVTYGAAVGGLFALVFAFVFGRIGGLGPRATAGLLAIGSFLAVVLLPGLKYPANPPAVGAPDSIGYRTVLYFLMLVISVAALAGTVALARSLWARHGAWNATLIAGGAFVAFIAVVQYLLPTMDEVPDQFSADLLWRFRLASLGVQTVLWTTIGLLFGVMAEGSVAKRFNPPN
jgi:hypothetical protein